MLGAERRQRIADRVVDPRATEVHWHPGEVDGVQSTTNTLACLEHHTGNAGPPQPRRRSEPRDTGAYQNHPIDLPNYFTHLVSMPPPIRPGNENSTTAATICEL